MIHVGEIAMSHQQQSRNPLTPWWIGLAIIIVTIAYAAYRFSCLECGPPNPFLLAIILGVMPAVYLTLMYLTFKSQGDSERK